MLYSSVIALLFIPLVLMCGGVCTLLLTSDYFKKVIGLNLMQYAVLIWFLIIGRIDQDTLNVSSNIFSKEIPIITASTDVANMINPIPHVLMLTAIVVGFSTTIVAFSLIAKLKHKTEISS